MKLGNDLLMDDIVDEIAGTPGGLPKLNENFSEEEEREREQSVREEREREGDQMTRNELGFSNVLGDMNMGNELMMDDIVENMAHVGVTPGDDDDNCIASGNRGKGMGLPRLSTAEGLMAYAPNSEACRKKKKMFVF